MRLRVALRLLQIQRALVRLAHVLVQAVTHQGPLDLQQTQSDAQTHQEDCCR